MSQDLKKSLDMLHEKQDSQTEKLNSLTIAVHKQETALEAYIRQSDRMAEELQKMNENMAVYNAELKIHIAGVVELKEQNRLMREENRQRDHLMSARIEIAELPIKWIQTTGKIAVWVGGIATALTAVGAMVAKALGMF